MDSVVVVAGAKDLRYSRSTHFTVFTLSVTWLLLLLLSFLLLLFSKALVVLHSHVLLLSCFLSLELLMLWSELLREPPFQPFLIQLCTVTASFPNGDGIPHAPMLHQWIAAKRTNRLSARLLPLGLPLEACPPTCCEVIDSTYF